MTHKKRPRIKRGKTAPPKLVASTGKRPRIKGGLPKAVKAKAVKPKPKKDDRPYIQVGIERGSRMSLRWPRHFDLLTKQFTFSEESCIGNLTGGISNVKDEMHKKITPLNFTNAVLCLRFINLYTGKDKDPDSPTFGEYLLQGRDGRCLYRLSVSHEFSAWFAAEKAAAALAKEAPLLLDYDPATVHERWDDAESVLVANSDGSPCYMVKFPDMACSLYPHQAADMDALTAMTRQDRGGLLAHGTGAGKTYIAGAYLIRNKLRGLVVCPALLVEGWKRKFKEMCPKPKGPDTRVYTVGSEFPGPRDRVERYQLIVVSYDMLKKHTTDLDDYVSGPTDDQIARELITKLNAIVFVGKRPERIDELNEAYNSDGLSTEQRAEIMEKFGIKLDQEGSRVLILDEAHFAKNANAGRTVRCLHLSLGAKCTLALTATPIKNRVKELHSLLRLTRRLWTSATLQEFQRMYEDEESRCELPDQLHGFFIRRLVEDIAELHLPPKIGPVPQQVELENLNDYRGVEADMIRWMIENGYDDEAVARAEAGLIIVKINKLRKMAAEGKDGSSARIVNKALSSGEQCVVFCSFNDPLKALVHKFRNKMGRNYKGQQWRGAGLIVGGVPMAKRQALIDNFQAGKIGLLCIGVTAGGMGIDLPVAARGFFLDQPWTPADMEQCMGRLHRIGQERTVEFVKLIATGSDGRPTIDQWMEQILLTKAECIRDSLGDAEAVERISPGETAIGQALISKYAEIAAYDPRFADDRARRI